MGRVENEKKLILFGLHGAYTNKVIHHISKFQNTCFQIRNGYCLNILKYAYNFFYAILSQSEQTFVKQTFNFLSVR